MDLFSIISVIILIYVLYSLVSAISALRREIREMKLKCIKSVYKNDISALEETSQDPMKSLHNNVIESLKYMKSMM
jgi:uncharacterized membrane protein